MQHIIWDWNGTLLNDTAVIVDAVNDALRPFGNSIALADYRDHYTRPVIRFYERVLSRALGPDEWQAIDDGFHGAYRARTALARLTDDCLRALDHIDQQGGSQSLLSMLREPDLMQGLHQHGLTRRFLHIDGLREGAGAQKAPYLAKHIERLSARSDLCGDRSRWVLIGDSLDDAKAAAANDLRCVLFDGGSHHRRELERAGVPVASTLMEALKQAGL